MKTRSRCPREHRLPHSLLLKAHGGRLGLMALAVGALLMAPGCSGPRPRKEPKPKPAPLTLRIEPTGDITNTTTLVYVGWASRTRTNLLDPVFTNALREVRRMVEWAEKEALRFDSQHGPMAISDKDRIWNLWVNAKQAETVVVIGDPPGYLLLGHERDWRVEIPLDKRCWRHLTNNTVHVFLETTGLRLREEPRFDWRGP